MREQILEGNPEEQFVFAYGFDKAIIGLDTSSMRIIYSVKKCVKILMKDMPEEEAQEYFYYNVAGAYMGEKTPIWCEDTFL